MSSDLNDVAHINLEGQVDPVFRITWPQELIHGLHIVVEIVKRRPGMQR
jgi:hypothetical protein